MMVQRTRKLGAVRALTPLVVAVIALNTASCGLLPDRDPAAPCKQTFAFESPSPLGDSSAFLAALDDAARGTSTVTLAEIAHVAGWHGGFDSVVVFFSNVGTDRNELNRRTDAATTQCWVGFEAEPRRGSSGGAYIFMRGEQPLQSVPWTGARPILGSNVRLYRMRASMVLRPLAAAPGGLPALVVQYGPS